MQLADTDQIGLIRKRCTDQGIVSVSEIATACEALRQKQVAAGLWCYENYTESGSHSEGMVKSTASSASRHSVIWPINHYLGLNRHPEVIHASIHALHKYGTGCGTFHVHFPTLYKIASAAEIFELCLPVFYSGLASDSAGSRITQMDDAGKRLAI